MTVNKCDIRYTLAIIFFTLGCTNFLPLSTAISARVRSEVVGEGFHRTLKYHIDTGTFKNSSCHIAVFVQLPTSLYVNVDELADLRRLHKSLISQSSFCSDGEVDVELFGERANEQNISICSRLSSTKTTLLIPIHQRYRLANRDEEPIRVYIPRPMLLIGCKDRIKEHRVSKIKICSSCLKFAQKWRDVFYRWDGDGDFVWEIAVGNTSQRTKITYITLSIALFGAAYVLYTINKSRQNYQKKIKAI